MFFCIGVAQLVQCRHMSAGITARANMESGKSEDTRIRKVSSFFFHQLTSNIFAMFRRILDFVYRKGFSWGCSVLKFDASKINGARNSQCNIFHNSWGSVENQQYFSFFKWMYCFRANLSVWWCAQPFYIFFLSLKLVSIPEDKVFIFFAR